MIIESLSYSKDCVRTLIENEQTIKHSMKYLSLFFSEYLNIPYALEYSPGRALNVILFLSSTTEFKHGICCYEE